MALPVQLLDAAKRLLGTWLSPLATAFFGEGPGRFSSPVDFAAAPRRDGRIYLSGTGLPTISNGSQFRSVHTYDPAGALIGEFYPCKETPFTWDAGSSELIVGGQKWDNVRAIRVEIEAEHRGFDADTNAGQVWNIAPEYLHADKDQKIGSGLGDVTTPEYFDVEYFKTFGAQITDVPGVAGDNTYTLWLSKVNDGTAQESVAYIDRTDELLGQATFTTADLVADPDKAAWDLVLPINTKFVRITQVRANDGANTDGGYTYDAMWS